MKAGFDFQQHFIRTRDERLKKAAGPDNTLKQYNADPDFVHAMVSSRLLVDEWLTRLND